MRNGCLNLTILLKIMGTKTMKRWKHTFRKIMLLGLAAMWIGVSADQLALPVSARGTLGTEQTGTGYGTAARERLTANEKRVYDAVKSAAGQIAQGQRASAVITVSGFTSLANSQEKITQLLDEAMACLLEDMPGNFYWYDKDGEAYVGEWASDENPVSSITVSLAVLPEYQSLDSLYTADTAKTKAAKPAVDRALAIVAKNENKTDYEKLKAYLTEICTLASAGETESGSRLASDTDPWPFIYVFDGDKSTTVGSRGYAAAFQYLCDASDFENAACYTADGEVSGAVEEKGHYWNIVRLEGSSYLVDVMNCDTGAPGAPDQLFLAGAEGSVQDGYTISLNKDRDSITYEYYTYLSDTLGSVLRLSPYTYLSPEDTKLRVTAPTAGEVTFGDPVDDGVLSGGTAVNQKGDPVDGVFTWADEVDFYGNAGTNTLKAVFTPDNPQYSPVEDIAVSVKINRRPVTVEAEAKTKAYGQPDPVWTYTYANVIQGYPLTGGLSRVSGENAGTYRILQGSLTDENNPNYSISFTEGTLEIQTADYTEQVNGSQSIWPGTGAFAEPVFTDEKGNKISGTLTYSYNGRSNLTYGNLTAELGKLPVDSKGTLTYTFVPGSNYIEKSGRIDFTVKGLEFAVGGQTATAANAVTVKSDAAYGDSWADIVKIGSITAKADSGSDSNSQHFTLNQSGTPEVGSGQSFQVLYNGTINGMTFTNQVVCEGKVDVKKRSISVSRGSYKVSKVYDQTRSGGNVTGELEILNLPAADAGRVNVTAVPEGYSDPNVNGQSTMAVKLSLSGAGAGNYELENTTVEVPCEITPKTIRPIVKVSGNYSYTGRAIVPAVTVSNGTEVVAASDYELALTNNRNAGTGKVSVRSKSGSNYTWGSPVEAAFTIDKTEYKGTKTGVSSMEYGGSAVFSMYSMLPEGYKLGEIRVSDPDKILAEKPVVSSTVLTCKLVNDKGKEGKTAEITVPVTESTNYYAYDLTFTVKMASQSSGGSGQQTPADTGNTGGTGSDSVTPPQSSPDIQEGSSSPAGTEETPGGASVTPVDRQNSKSKNPGGFSTGPIIWCLIGMVLSAAVIGGTFFVRSRWSGKED